ncbi:GNAT-type Acetyltransferase [Gaiella occulta]|uniref:GNAT-type Acetyltransferase n=1 Tax=Gaiella occulta TaxID=1002870 RepID=A0A7M2YW82_9ACTN|nr:GNAT family N-acetyltransferase [Gaiella occulta]RDI74402.1 GNAT-type Acetyltransferase [Gaiella occulta]
MAYRRPEPLGKHHRLDQFDCGEQALDKWLRRHARGAHASGSARVFVTTLEDGQTVVGYYALAAAQVAPENAAARALKGQPRARPVAAILLAGLAVDRGHQGAGLGRSLLQDVLLRCLEAAEAIGARVLLVHATHDAAEAWYMQYGFEESPTDPLHLMTLLEDVRASLKRHGVEGRSAEPL